MLLRADKSAANFSDKSLLKNLGHWLGMLTLAKNKPILHADIDMKSLLIESYNKGLQVKKNLVCVLDVDISNAIQSYLEVKSQNPVSFVQASV